MKKLFVVFVILFQLSIVYAQNVGIGTTIPSASSLLELKASNKGVLVPRMTTAEKNAIASPAVGLLIFQTDSIPGFYYYDAVAWQRISPGVDAANLTLSNLVSPTAVNVDLVPQNDAASSIGSSSLSWNELYLAGDMYLKNQRFLSVKGSNSYVGPSAGNPSVTGSYNTATGTSALATNISGNWNTANGYNSLMNANNAYSNTGVGFQAALANTTGSYNTAIGVLSLGSNQTGVSNSAVGVAAINNLTSGSYNSAIGYFSGANLPTGSFNTYLGSYADGPSGVAISNATAIGYNAAVGGSNSVRVGNASVSSIGGQAGWTTFPSDRKFKTNVREDVPGLPFIKKLRPVTYNVNAQAIEEATKPPATGTRNEATGAKPNTLSAEEVSAMREKSAIKYTGFIAQEVEQAAKELNYDFSGVDAPKTDKGIYGLRYAEFVVPLVKAVQELSKENNDLKDELRALKEQVNKMAVSRGK